MSSPIVIDIFSTRSIFELIKSRWYVDSSQLDIQEIIELDYYQLAKYNRQTSDIVVKSNLDGDLDVYLFSNQTLSQLELGELRGKVVQYEWMTENKILLQVDMQGDEQYDLYTYNISDHQVQPLIVDEYKKYIYTPIEINQRFYFGRSVDGLVDIYCYHLQEGSQSQIYQQDELEYAAEFSKNFENIAITYQIGESGIHHEIVIIDLTSQQIKQRFSFEETSRLYPFKWIADDTKLILRTDVRGRMEPCILDIESNTIEYLVNTEFETMPAILLDNERILVVYQTREGQDKLFNLILETRELQEIDHPQGQLPYFNYFERIDQSSFLYGFTTPHHKEYVYKYTLDDNSSNLVIQPQKELPETLKPEMRHITYEYQGVIVPAILSVPKELSGPRKALIAIHGGPWANDGLSFKNSSIIYGAYNYTIIYPNYRGSTGYGRQWMQSLEGNVGEHDLNDVIGAYYYLTNSLEIPTTNIGITGVSYGGYLTLLAIGKYPKLFSAACSIVGMSDWKLLLESGNQWIRSSFRKLLGSREEEIDSTASDASPISYVENVTTPVFLIHNINDSRVIFDHSEKFYNGVIKHNLKADQTAILWAQDDSGHMGLTSSADLVEEYQRIIQFFENHIE